MIKVAVPITGNEEFKALKKVIFSGKFVSGNNVEKFEKEYAKFIGTKYAVAVNSGTAALHASLASLDLKKDDVDGIKIKKNLPGKKIKSIELLVKIENSN